ncbi:hypothetical protein VCHC19A1_0546, partial [Vibrio cholerae HC-19A1]
MTRSALLISSSLKV